MNGTSLIATSDVVDRFCVDVAGHAQSLKYAIGFANP
jgi:hypothetical protein